MKINLQCAAGDVTGATFPLETERARVFVGFGRRGKCQGIKPLVTL